MDQYIDLLAKAIGCMFYKGGEASDHTTAWDVFMADKEMIYLYKICDDHLRSIINDTQGDDTAKTNVCESFIAFVEDCCN